MLNQFVLVGRVKSITEKEIELKVNKIYKNKKDEYEEYIVKVSINNIYKNMKDYVDINCVVGVKGRIEESNELVAEKITFLSDEK